MGVSRIKILDAATTTATGSTFPAGQQYKPSRTFSGSIAGTGAVSATVLIEVTNNPDAGWGLHVTLTMSGTTTDTAHGAAEGSWSYYRARVTAISGTGCAATVWMGA